MNAAKKLGYGPEAVKRDDHGMWYVFVPSGDMLAQEAAARLADQMARDLDNQVHIATGVAFPDRKAPVPANPVAFIRHTLNSQRFPSRKLAIAYLVEQGINIHTAKTQYQRWHSGDL